MNENLKIKISYIKKTFEIESMYFNDGELYKIVLNKKRKEVIKMGKKQYNTWEDYFIVGTDTLKNIPNIQDKKLLTEYEKKMSAERLSELYDDSITGEFNQRHLYSIHEYLFQDVYDWAGETRAVPMMKQTTFLEPERIDTYLDVVFDEVNKDIVNIENEYQFANFLSNLFYCLTYAHPFREGNGRTIREFIRQLVNSIDFDFGSYDIDYGKMDQQNIAFGICCSAPMFMVSEFQKSLIKKPLKQKIKTI